jgi:CHASE1-domain containing sensor protein
VRRRLIWAAIFLPASIYLLLFFTGGALTLGPQRLDLSPLANIVSTCVPVLTVMAVGLGAVNLFSLHGTTLIKRRPEWPLSLVVCLSFALTFWACVAQNRLDARRRQLEAAAQPARQQLLACQRLSDPTERDRALRRLTPEQRQALENLQTFEDAYHFEPRRFYAAYVNAPLASTVMALLGFYITYAAYRAFRLRSLEATVMMLSAAVVILGSDPVGGALSRGILPTWADFDNRIIAAGMQRGLRLGIAVATIAASLRILLGLERGIVDVHDSQG